MTRLFIRPAHRGDLDAILQIQARCYTAIIPESPRAMDAKLVAAPDSCFVACLGDDAPVAYLLSLPWRFDDPPHLDEQSCQPPVDADTLHLHDLAVTPEARGSGAAGALVAAFMTALAASRLGRASLIAIQGSAGWWARHAFAPVTMTPELAEHLASYGSDACYMSLQRPARIQLSY
ncbi:GNAT family N-acetyltransferase [Zoogloea sp.]|uniref:GNAT family N-acetyltransferase n=1 Tax=Zoogloea sp. TaxID=49181 RepID=UPI0035AE6FA9